MIKYDRLWETMDQKGVTQYALIHKYHMSKSLLQRLRKNEGVTMHTINTLCTILDCNIEDIATFYNDKKDTHIDSGYCGVSKDD
ncbi:MAG: helix-turn-helix transcriptional regulator [Lachnospiraceae bacterium]|nr:helix-turn-helix transcriptional regulator [Lachnospiraceae bacterium]